MDNRPLAKHEHLLDEHFGAAKPDWGSFQKSLKSKGFAAMVKDDPRSDTKLKRFADVLNAYKSAKGGKVVKGSSGKKYKVKYLPDLKRYACNCGDFTYVKSVKTHGDTECRHIKQVRSMEKKASIRLMGDRLGVARMILEDKIKVASPLTGIGRALSLESKAKKKERSAKSFNDAYHQAFPNDPGFILGLLKTARIG